MNKIINIPDEIVSAIHNAFAAKYNRPEMVKVKGETIPNPETKESFTNKKIRGFINGTYESYKAEEADSARLTAIANAKIFTKDIEVN